MQFDQIKRRECGSRARRSGISVSRVPAATTSGSIGIMSERYLRGIIALVKAGKTSRRGFVQKMIQLGLTVPLANAMLAHAGVALAQTKFEYKPTKRGGGGALKVLWWQGPTLLNPHLSLSPKAPDRSRVFYEPLAAWYIQ